MKELTYNFTTFDLANRYKPKTDIIVRKSNEAEISKEVLVEKADEITLNFKVADSVYFKPQFRVQAAAKDGKIHVV